MTPSYPFYLASCKPTEWLNKVNYETASLFYKLESVSVVLLSLDRNCSSFYIVPCSLAVFTFYILESPVFVSLGKCVEEMLIDH